MTKSRDLLRCLTAALALLAIATITGKTHSLQAAESNGYCVEESGYYCVSTQGGGYVFNYKCDAGSCASCHSGGGRCAPFGSGVNIEGYWP